MDILEKQELRMSNVLSFRSKLSQQDFQSATERLGEFIKIGGYSKTGYTATVTYSVEQQNSVQLLDIEVLIPLDQPFVPPEGCVYKPEIHITNAVSIRHVGNPSGLQDTCNALLVPSS